MAQEWGERGIDLAEVASYAMARRLETPPSRPG